jgi:hypothetical protein
MVIPLFLLMLLPPLVVFPPAERKADVILLVLLRAATEQNDDALAVVAKIDPVAGAKIYLALENASPDAFGVGEVSQPHAVEGGCDLAGGLGVQLAEPVAKSAATARVAILTNLAHLLQGNIYYTIVKGCRSGRCRGKK